MIWSCYSFRHPLRKEGHVRCGVFQVTLENVKGPFTHVSKITVTEVTFHLSYIYVSLTFQL